MIKEITGSYNPSSFEREIYDFWLKKKYFHGITGLDNKSPFCIVIPPPNITGYLHMGHALNNSLQDIVIRYKRMKGFNCAWIPGTDHAGIATQNVVERELEKQGISRYELGREKFIEKVWEWKEQHGSRIIEQLKILGCSCDWDRERFTFDENYVRAVNKEFVTLYKNGLIYQGNYIVNWCPRCGTAISDIEVEHHEKRGSLWEIKYPLVDDKTERISEDEFIVVSTTRPETMFGDSAVAVNPNDERYKNLIGRFVLLPIAERKIPIIADEHADIKFGTGAVKVTPAHDPNDFEIGKRHNLAKINIMNPDATLNKNAGKYAGLDRFEARKKLLEELKEKGYLLGKKDHKSSIGFCSRCSTTIEPRISLQWYVSMKKLAGPAIEAVKSGRIKFIPKKWEKLYFNWMENIKDWCISRQLWWGHRIPVWYCKNCNEIIVSENEPKKCTKCNSSNLIQDEDVLDTWFSSDLWPFASLGWPDDTPELHYFFPTNVLITAHDIIFFWVARMIMMSLYFMHDEPFKEVFINPLVNDEKGQKMSKSKGNVIDPTEIVEKYGCDVLRFTLASLTTPGRNLLLGNEKIEGSRNFANKIWNASRFVLMNIKGIEVRDIDLEESKTNLNIWDRWILDRLSITIKNFEKYIEKYNFSFACKLVYNFFWSEFCDWYIEAAKIKIYNGSPEERKYTCAVLYYVLENYLRILHPIMPFLTEAIWQCLPKEGESIMIQEFPRPSKKFISNKESKDIDFVFKVIGTIRKLRSEMNVKPSSKIKIYLNSVGNGSSGTRRFDKLRTIKENENYIKTFCKSSEVSYEAPKNKDNLIKSSVDNIEIYVAVEELVDFGFEVKRIGSEIKKVKLELEKSENKINNPEFISKAPAKVVEKELNKVKELKGRLNFLDEELNKINKSIKRASKIP